MTRETSENTVMFKVEAEEVNQAKEILLSVYAALKEKGYNPINQLVGYLLSGDPAYITSHNNARSKIRRLERDELLEELVRSYLKDAQDHIKGWE
ncbi:IreB family regulatory phosphoprotein [Desulfofundulus sp.]|uniref:IreB family regulatory phosphoprotein n=1 Tax=Desulfofundulus sp. TaxID=2282750 RepID=UPI003C7640DD